MAIYLQVLGDAEGASDGDADGTSEGESDGNAVGASVGEADGILEGATTDENSCRNGKEGMGLLELGIL
jgi:hypothetical protein